MKNVIKLQFDRNWTHKLDNLLLRCINASDLSAVLNMHQEIVDGLSSKGIYLLKSADYFYDRLKGKFAERFVMLGAFDGDALIAYSSMLITSLAELDTMFQRSFALCNRFDKIAFMEDAAVRQTHRGRGLQAILNQTKVAMARSASVDVCSCIVDARNVKSIHNLMGEGYVVSGWVLLKTGWRRLFLEKASMEMNVHGEKIFIDVNQQELIEKRLADGFIGISITSEDEVSASLCMVKYS